MHKNIYSSMNMYIYIYIHIFVGPYSPTQDAIVTRMTLHFEATGGIPTSTFAANRGKLASFVPPKTTGVSEPQIRASSKICSSWCKIGLQFLLKAPAMVSLLEFWNRDSLGICFLATLPKNNIFAPEWRLGNYSPFGKLYFHVLY